MPGDLIRPERIVTEPDIICFAYQPRIYNYYCCIRYCFLHTPRVCRAHRERIKHARYAQPPDWQSVREHARKHATLVCARPQCLLLHAYELNANDYNRTWHTHGARDTETHPRVVQARVRLDQLIKCRRLLHSRTFACAVCDQIRARIVRVCAMCKVVEM